MDVRDTPENQSPEEGQSNSSQQNQPSTSLAEMKDEKCRLATFKYWPNPNISPESLSKAGFYYFNQEDQVKCAWCKGVIAKWEKGDNAFEEHQRFFPDCQRVLLGPLIELNGDAPDLGIQHLSAPKKPKFSCLDARLRSYSKWPIPDIQKPEVLSQAGFYYQYQDDQVRCFHCNGGLRSWQKEDDPWFEHAKWFPHCQFLKLVKGTCYVSEVQGKGRDNNFQDVILSESPPYRQHITLDEAMSSDIVQRALEMGLNEGRILNAVRRQLEFQGKSFDTTEELVEVVLEGQIEEEEENNELSSSIVREVSRILNNIFSPGDFDSDVPSPTESFSILENLAENITTEQIMPSPLNEISQNSQISIIEEISDLEPSCSTNLINSNETNTQEKLENDSICLQSEQTGPSSTQKLENQQSLEEENRKLKDARLCKVCMDDEVAIVFLPCGHLVVCTQCASGVETCPLCRTAIRGFVRTFLS